MTITSKQASTLYSQRHQSKATLKTPQQLFVQLFVANKVHEVFEVTQDANSSEVVINIISLLIKKVAWLDFKANSTI